MFSVSEILKIVSGKLISGCEEKDVKGFSIDSRSIQNQEVFVAIKGDRFDGHDFIPDAIKNGARAVIVENIKKLGSFDQYKDTPVILVKNTINSLRSLAIWIRDKFNVPVICITGSNGKTTTKDMVTHVLSARYNVLKSISSYNNQIGLPLTLLRLRPEHDIVVLELGTNHFGEIGYLAGIARPDIAVITNIGPSHLEGLKNLKGVLKEKTTIFKYLRRGGVALVNYDDEMLRSEFYKKDYCNNNIVLGFGKRPGCDFMIEDIKIHKDFLTTRVGRVSLRINSIALHNLYNMLVAYSCGLIFGVDNQKIKHSLRSFKFPTGRINLLKVDGFSIINDTYNANPLSLESALKSLLTYNTSGRRIAVLGDMLELGNKNEYYHKLIGKMIAHMKIDIVVTVGRQAKIMANTAKQAGFFKNNLHSFYTNKDVSSFLKDIIKTKDAILIKGSRLMRMEEIVQDLKELKDL